MNIKTLKRYNRNEMFSTYSRGNFQPQKDLILIPLHYVQQGHSTYFYKAFIIDKNRNIIKEVTQDLKIKTKFFKTNNIGHAFKVKHMMTMKSVLDNLQGDIYEIQK